MRSSENFHSAPRLGLTREVQRRAFAPHPNCKFNVDANMGHRFAILLAHVGALRPCGAPAPVN